MLNNSISTSNNDEEKKELYSQRLGLFFNMGKWEGKINLCSLLLFMETYCLDVLKDIQYLEKKYTIDNSIRAMKWFVNLIYLNLYKLYSFFL
jgi:hypothetical protein